MNMSVLIVVCSIYPHLYSADINKVLWILLNGEKVPVDQKPFATHVASGGQRKRRRRQGQAKLHTCKYGLAITGETFWRKVNYQHLLAGVGQFQPGSVFKKVVGL